jgi:hypothetical protein
MMYLGFDIGKRRHDAALLDTDGTVVRQLRFAATRAWRRGSPASRRPWCSAAWKRPASTG